MNKEEITDEEIKKIIQFYYDGCDNFDYEREYTRKLEVYISQLQKKAELEEHYKHLYSEVKKQKDDAVDFIHKELDRFDCEGSMSISMRISYFQEDLLRMLGETDD